MWAGCGYCWWFHSSEDRQIGLRTVDIKSFYVAYKCGTVPLALNVQYLIYCRHANKSSVLMLGWILNVSMNINILGFVLCSEMGIFTEISFSSPRSPCLFWYNPCICVFPLFFFNCFSRFVKMKKRLLLMMLGKNYFQSLSAFSLVVLW